jgi:hypothetical protein
LWVGCELVVGLWAGCDLVVGWRLIGRITNSFI